MIDILGYYNQWVGQDASAIYNAIFQITGGSSVSGVIADFGSAVMGPDVKDDIIKLTILQTLFFQKTEGTILSYKQNASSSATAAANSATAAANSATAAASSASSAASAVEDGLSDIKMGMYSSDSLDVIATLPKNNNDIGGGNWCYFWWQDDGSCMVNPGSSDGDHSGVNYIYSNINKLPAGVTIGHTYKVVFKRYVYSVGSKPYGHDENSTTIVDSAFQLRIISFDGNGDPIESSGNVAGAWYKKDGEYTVPLGAKGMRISLHAAKENTAARNNEAVIVKMLSEASNVDLDESISGLSIALDTDNSFDVLKLIPKRDIYAAHFEGFPIDIRWPWPKTNGPDAISTVYFAPPLSDYNIIPAGGIFYYNIFANSQKMPKGFTPGKQYRVVFNRYLLDLLSGEEQPIPGDVGARLRFAYYDMSGNPMPDYTMWVTNSRSITVPLAACGVDIQIAFCGKADDPNTPGSYIDADYNIANQSAIIKLLSAPTNAELAAEIETIKAALNL